MNIATTVARLVLGLAFVFAGASVFFMSSAPPQPGLAGAFNDVFFKSHCEISRHVRIAEQSRVRPLDHDRGNDLS